MNRAIREFKHDDFEPPWWMRNRHAQTVLGSYWSERPEVPRRREWVELPDGDRIALDWMDGEPDAPIVLACHGLESSSDSGYVRRLMARLREEGWRGAAMNFRGCGGESNRLLRSYHSGDTGDLGRVIEMISGRFPSAPLFLTGFSLGGNVALKWLGEKGEAASRIARGACACSVPYDLLRCQGYMGRGIRRFYVWHFLRSLKRKAREKAKLFPGAFDAAKVLRAKTFEEFDDAFTAPLHGFKDYRDYYGRSSCNRYLRSVRVPTLLIAARDDPFAPPDVLPNEYDIDPERIRTLFLDRGGHLGFYDRRMGKAWLGEQIIRWFRLLV